MNDNYKKKYEMLLKLYAELLIEQTNMKIDLDILKQEVENKVKE